MSRFTIRYDKSIEDEQEKQFVFDELVKMGGADPARRCRSTCATPSRSRGASRCCRRSPAPSRRGRILADLCERNDNTYTRDPSKKIQLLDYLGEHSDPRAAKALVPYLTDMDEGVRFVTVEALLRHKDVESAREPLLQLLTNEKEESRRIKKRIVDGFADLGWDVKGFSGTVEKMLADCCPARASTTTARSSASRSECRSGGPMRGPFRRRRARVRALIPGIL